MTALILLALSIMCSAWAYKTREALVAWCRVMLAGFLLILAASYAVIDTLKWAFT